MTERTHVFRITVERGFAASHQLMLPDGSREPMHSHNWLVRATVAAARLDGMGLVMDFNRLASLIDGITGGFAGKRLEELPAFAARNASAEHVAEFLYEGIRPALDSRVRLESVSVMETSGCWACYSGD
jgi:6-pyruvoyltetrahydropterin/6-carboxytetrahydropterin synthase